MSEVVPRGPLLLVSVVAASACTRSAGPAFFQNPASLSCADDTMWPQNDAHASSPAPRHDVTVARVEPKPYARHGGPGFDFGAGDDAGESYALERTDAEHDLDALRRILLAWSRDVVGTRRLAAVSTPAMVLDAYEIFTDFYTPTNLRRVTGRDEQPELYRDAEFVIVQSRLRITKSTTLCHHLGLASAPAVIALTIEDFSPAVDVPGAHVLHMTDEDQARLLDFLGDESVPVGTGNLMNPARATGESQNRERFLAQLLPIRHGHWRGWHLVSYPDVNEITFSLDGQRAAVDFRVGYEGGQAFYHRDGATWRLLTTRMTWIE